MHLWAFFNLLALRASSTRFDPIGDIKRNHFNHLAGAGEQRGQHGETNILEGSDRINERRRVYRSVWIASTKSFECESVRTFAYRTVNAASSGLAVTPKSSACLRKLASQFSIGRKYMPESRAAFRKIF